MHWHAWGADDALYFADDDGANFGNPWNFAHLLKATGDPPDFHLEELHRFPQLAGRNDKYRRYVDGVLAVGSRLFVAAYDYNDDPETGKPFWFLDANSDHGGIVALMYSDDGGQTFQNVPDPDAETRYFLGPDFAGLSFVGFGPGCTRASPSASATSSTPSRTTSTGRAATTSAWPAYPKTACSTVRPGSSTPATRPGDDAAPVWSRTKRPRRS